jgi:hypothetical protein
MSQQYEETSLIIHLAKQRAVGTGFKANTRSSLKNSEIYRRRQRITCGGAHRFIGSKLTG